MPSLSRLTYSLGITMHILVGGPVEAAHLVIQDALKVNVQQHDRLWCKRPLKCEAYLFHGIVVLYING